MLETIRVRRFKSIVDAEITLGRVTVLVGPNNAGKSSFLQAIQFAVSTSQSLKLDGTSRWTAAGTSGTLSTQQLVYTPLRDVHKLALGGQLRQAETSQIEVHLNDAVSGSTTIAVSRGKNKNILVRVLGKDLGLRLEDLDAPFSIVAPGLAGIPSYEEYRAPGIVRRAAARGDANSVFRNVLWTLKKDHAAWTQFQLSLRSVFPDLELSVEFDEHTDEHISAWASEGDGPWLPIDSCGTGVLQAIQVLSYIGVYKPTLLILDEPDSHLHPDNQRKLARLLDDLTKSSELQVLISTHSRHFLDEFGELDANINWFSSGEVREGDFDTVSALLDLGALDAGDRLRGGETKVVVVTEDRKTNLLKKLLVASGLNLEMVQVWSYAGSSNLQAAKVLGKFIRASAPGTVVVVHRDRDYLESQEVEAYVAALQVEGIEVFITAGTDVESHFLSVDHLAAVLPELGTDAIADLLEKATEAVREKSVSNMVDHRWEAARSTGRNDVNVGSLGFDASRDFDGDPERYRHGKATLKRMRDLLQADGRPVSALVQGSDELSVSLFQNIAERVNT